MNQYIVYSDTADGHFVVSADSLTWNEDSLLFFRGGAVVKAVVGYGSISVYLVEGDELHQIVP